MSRFSFEKPPSFIDKLMFYTIYNNGKQVSFQGDRLLLTCLNSDIFDLFKDINACLLPLLWKIIKVNDFFKIL